MKRIFPQTTLILLLLTQLALGWGGHPTVQRLINEGLPAEIRAFFTPAQLADMISFSVFPDNSRFLPVDTVGQEAILFLNSRGITKCYDLHFAKGRTALFYLLVDAFQRNDSQKARIWLASLGHNISDESALNHDYISAYLSSVRTEYSLQFPNGKAITDYPDFLMSEVEKDTTVMNMLKRSMRGNVPKVLNADPREIVLRLGMLGLTSHDSLVSLDTEAFAALQSWADGGSKQEYLQAIGKLGEIGARAALDYVWAAWQYAKSGKAFTLEPGDSLAFSVEKEKYLREKPVLDGVFTPYLRPLTAPAVGVVFEPSLHELQTYITNQGVFNHQNKIITSAIMRELQKNKVPFYPIDVRQIVSAGLPSPSEVPVVIADVGKYGSFLWIKKDSLEIRFADYTAKGGRLIWIGGKTSKALGTLYGALRASSAPDWPVSDSIVNTGSIRFAGEFAKKFGTETRSFHSPLNLKNGIAEPKCNMVLFETAGVVPLIEFAVNGTGLYVGGACMDGNGYKHIFLPEYVIAPYLLSHDKTVRTLGEPQLDSVGGKILMACIEMVAPAIIYSEVSIPGSRPNYAILADDPGFRSLPTEMTIYSINGSAIRRISAGNLPNSTGMFKGKKLAGGFYLAHGMPNRMTRKQMLLDR